MFDIKCIKCLSMNIKIVGTTIRYGTDVRVGLICNQCGSQEEVEAECVHINHFKESNELIPIRNNFRTITVVNCETKEFYIHHEHDSHSDDFIPISSYRKTKKRLLMSINQYLKDGYTLIPNPFYEVDKS